MKKKYALWLVGFCIVFSVVMVHADTCQGIFGQELLDEIKSIFDIIRIVVPIVLLVLTSIDFAKSVFVDNKDGLNKAKNNFLKRAVAVLIIFFAPEIINLILDFINEETMRSCINQVK